MTHCEGFRSDGFLRWAHRELPDFDVTHEPQVALLTGGRSNVTFRITDGSGRDWALRRPPLGHVMPSAHDVGRDFLVMSGLRRVEYPVPRVHALCSDENVIGAPFVIMDFVYGETLATRSQAVNMTVDQRANASRSLTQALIALHAVDLQEAGLEGLGKHTQFLTRQVKRWMAQWELTKTREMPAIEQLFARLLDSVEAFDTYAPALVHGDFRLDNLITDDTHSTIHAVLDWEMSTIGHPILDLAITLVYWSDPQDHLRNLVPVSARATHETGFWTRRDILDEYQFDEGVAEDLLDFCVVLACAKLAVIMESVHYRTLHGQQLGVAHQDGEDMGRAAEALVQMGVNVMRQGSLRGLQS